MIGIGVARWVFMRIAILLDCRHGSFHGCMQRPMRRTRSAHIYLFPPIAPFFTASKADKSIPQFASATLPVMNRYMQALTAAFLLMILSPVVVAEEKSAMPAVAFFYGSDPPWNELRAFDWVVVEPGHVKDAAIEHVHPARIYAYVSLGEVHPKRPYFTAIPRDWRLGPNAAWNSEVIDQAQAGWTKFFIEQVIEPLWERGFRAFFIDTLDSYHIYSSDDTERARQEAGMVATIREIKRRFPESHLIINRGFEILSQLHDIVDAVVAESLFARWNPAEKKYTDVPEKDRHWLQQQLVHARDNYKLPVIVIDYLPPTEKARAREIALRIDALGFIPWVCDHGLETLGTGLIEIMPRRILIINDQASDDVVLMKLEPRALFLAAPANYLGYAVEFHDVHAMPPEGALSGRYAGIVLWLEEKLPADSAKKWVAWVSRQTEVGMPVLLLDNIGFLAGTPEAVRLGLRFAPAPRAMEKISIVNANDMFGYEAAPRIERTAFYPLTIEQGESLLTLRDSQGDVQTAAAIMPWGGYVLEPFSLITLPDQQQTRWVVNPFTLLERAFRLPAMPVPDLTTENGRRLLLVHMDGDGFASRAEFPGSPYAAEVLRDQILKKFQIPISISVIEGEVGPHGLYPEQAPKLETIARSIFALPHVEIGSHTYSHPFKWMKAIESETEASYNLPIPGYDFDLRREIQGSVDYINSRLAPPGKQVKLFQWSGDCNPNGEAISLTNQIGLPNINGGRTVITNSNRTLTAVAPIGLYKDGEFQVFAPNQNENVYTNDWLGPFYGYRRVIETYELTDSPRRLKPINIYFHTYSASKLASLKALDEIFAWTLLQKPFPIYTSDYVRKAQAFDQIVVARVRDHWRIRNLGALRELRIPQSLGLPDLAASRGIAGFSEYGDDLFVHAAGNHADLHLTKQKPKEPYLVSANGYLNAYSKDGEATRFQFLANVPLELQLKNAGRCVVSVNQKTYKPRREGGNYIYRVDNRVSEPIEAECS